MAATIIGNGLTAAVTSKNSPEIRETENGTEYVYRKVQKKGVAIGIAFGTANTDASYTGTVLKGINHLAQPGGGYETIELIYSDPVPGSPSTPPVGTVIQEGRANSIERPIEQHPDFVASTSVYDVNGVLTVGASTTGTLVTPFVGSALKYGVTSYMTPAPTYTRTEILTSFTFTEANIIAAVGTRNAPNGMTSPTASKWLKTRLSIRKVGKVIEKSETWQSSEPGKTWDTDIYT